MTTAQKSGGLLAVGIIALALMGVADPCAAELVCATASETAPVDVAPGAAAGKVAGGVRRPPPPIGRVNALVLFADFADGSPQALPGAADALFSPDLPGSLTHFYRTMSSGRFLLEGHVAPRRYRSQSPSSAYVAREEGAFGEYSRFVFETLDEADEDIDYAQFDNDGPDGIANSGDDDGWVDYVFVVVRSAPHGFIRGGATGVAGLGQIDAHITADLGVAGAPIRISPSKFGIALISEGPFRQMAGTMAHEFAHAFGLPDLYDVEYGSGEEDSAGIGRWGLMGWGAHGWTGADGPNELSAWSLQQLGWIHEGDGSLVDVEGDGRLVVRDLRQGGSVYRVGLPTRPSPHGMSRQYLLLEYRSRERLYGAGMPSEGLLVWHVSPSQHSNADETHKVVDLVCADGVYLDAGYPRGLAGLGQLGGDNLDYWSHEVAYQESRAGNKGDATDPFDGVRFTRLAIDSNPSVDAHGVFPGATRGPQLRMHRDGDAMVVDVELARWRGEIDSEVHWAGRVIVDGDLRIAPRGKLTIHEGSEVLMADVDSRQAGLDPRLVEILVEGGLVIRGPHARLGDVVFGALQPGGRWYGIEIRPAEGSAISAASDGYRIADAERGIYFAHAGPGSVGDELFQGLDIEDGATGATAGNRDGKLTAGETVILRPYIANWSMAKHRNLQVIASWDQALHSADEPSGRLETVVFDLGPGQRRVFDFPPMEVASEAWSGDSLEVVIQVEHMSFSTVAAESHRVPLAVVGDYPGHQVELSFADEAVLDGGLRLGAGIARRMVAQVSGEIDSVEIVVSSRLDDSVLEIVPMHRQASVGAASFAADWAPPEEGTFRLRPRVTDRQGHVTFSAGEIDVWGVSNPEARVAMVFVAGEYSVERRAFLVEAMRNRLGDFDVEPIFIFTEEEDASHYMSMLARQAASGGVAAWLGPSVSREMEPALQAYLEDGGRLLLLSPLARSTATFRREALHVSRLQRGKSRRLAGVGAFAGVSDQATVGAFEVRPPAAAAIIDGDGNATGLAMITPTQRLVLLVADPTGLTASLEALLGAAFVHLLRQRVDVEISLSGTIDGELFLLPASGHTRIDVMADASVGSVDLHLRGRHEIGAGTTVVADRVPSRSPLQRSFSATLSLADFPQIDNGRLLVSATPYDDVGRRLASLETVEAVKLEAEARVMLVADPAYGEEVDRVTAALAEGGRRATTVLAAPGDEALQRVLARRAEQQAATVVWMTDALLPAAVHEMARRIAEAGGRVVLASPTLATSEPVVRAFLRDLGIVRRLPVVISNVSGAPIAHGSASVLARHQPLVTEPPAVVLLTNASDRAVATITRVGRGTVAAVSLDLPDIVGDEGPNLLDRLVASIEQVDRVELSVATGDQARVIPTVRADRPFAVHTRLDEPADHVEAIMRSLSDGSVKARIPMSGAGSAFRAEITPPSMDRYSLSLRIQRGERMAVADTSVAVYALAPEDDQRVLLVTTTDMGSRVLEAITADADSVLARNGARVVALPFPKEEDNIPAGLLYNFAGPGEGVVWLSDNLSTAAEDGIRRFVSDGGRMLLVSLALGKSPDNRDFVRDFLGISAGWVTRVPLLWTAGSDADAPHPLRGDIAATSDNAALVRDTRGTVVGAVTDHGAGRVIHLGFDLEELPPADRRAVLVEALNQLGVTATEGLRLDWMEPPSSLIATGSLEPRLVVYNGSTQAEPTLIRYAVLGQVGVVHSGQMELESLAPKETRAITMPPWPAREPGLYTMTVSMAQGDSLVQLAPRQIRVIAARTPFEDDGLGEPIGRANGVGWLDADGDGSVELYLTRLGVPNLLLRTDGTGFVAAGDVGLDSGGEGRSFAVGDTDGDGDLDVYLINDGDNALLRNDGAGRFTPVDAPDLGDRGSGRAAAFLDADGNGELDLYLVNARGPNRLLMQTTQGWRDETAESGLHDDGDGRGLALADYDNDGDTDLFVASLGGGRLFANEGEGFADRSIDATTVPGNVSAVFGDIDGDGVSDLFLASQSGDNRMLLGTGSGFVELEGGSFGERTVGSALVDFDNDGDLDLLTTALDPSAGGDQLYDNAGDAWIPVGSLLGLRSQGMGRGLSYADVDADGDQDLAIADAEASRVYWNRIAADRTWLAVVLAGRAENRFGFGARIEVTANGVAQMRQVQPTYGYGSQRPTTVHFGFGGTPTEATVAIRWPDGTRTVHEHVALGRQVVIGHPAVGTAVGEGEGGELPISFRLEPGFPNPFNAGVALRFSVDTLGPARLEVYGVNGQRVRTLLSRDLSPGRYRDIWDGRDEAGHSVASGVYLLRLASVGREAYQRVLLLK